MYEHINNIGNVKQFFTSRLLTFKEWTVTAILMLVIEKRDIRIAEQSLGGLGHMPQAADRCCCDVTEPSVTMTKRFVALSDDEAPSQMFRSVLASRIRR
jgi:hypothetical protein